MTDFSAIVDEAEAAGNAAAARCVPTPMIVGSPSTPFGNDIDPNKPTYFVADGVCGFAWVSFAGNTSFGRWMKKTGKARDHYPKGLCVWVRDYNQSMQLKEAYAEAYAAVLRKHDIEAYAGSRMD